MKKYRVTVEKGFRSISAVVVEARNADAALLRVSKAVHSGRVNRDSLEWCDPEYSYGTFDVTGDVEEAEPEDKLTKIKSP